MKMCSEPLPKEFEKVSEVLPFQKYGTSILQEFQDAERALQHLEWLKKVGLTEDEIQLYQDNKSGSLDKHSKMEASVLDSKLLAIFKKIKDYEDKSTKDPEPQPTTSTKQTEDIFETIEKAQPNQYPDGHPMNNLKKMEETLFGHIKHDIIPISKRRKIMRRHERKKEKIMNQNFHIDGQEDVATVSRPGSLWDVKDLPTRSPANHVENQYLEEINTAQNLIGPRKRNMYTVQENKIVRLEPVPRENNEQQEYEAVDIVVPENAAEAQLLEGTKMSVDDIRKIDRFQDYEPGIPSKVLYLKNISPAVAQEQLSLLFNQFVLENGGPIDVRLMTGRMRGQAFVGFNNEDLAIRALDEVNGTILSGRPIIAEFGRNSNRIQNDDFR